MKLALIFLLAFVAVSCLPQRQQKQRLSWSLMPVSYYSPRAFYQWQNPYFLDNAYADSPNPLLVRLHWQLVFIVDTSY